jgi:hypothetical protein
MPRMQMLASGCPQREEIRVKHTSMSSRHGNVALKISTGLLQMPYNGPAAEILALALPALNMVAEMATY